MEERTLAPDLPLSLLRDHDPDTILQKLSCALVQACTQSCNHVLAIIHKHLFKHMHTCTRAHGKRAQQHARDPIYAYIAQVEISEEAGEEAGEEASTPVKGWVAPSHLITLAHSTTATSNNI
jgi:hypothetical protein